MPGETSIRRAAPADYPRIVEILTASGLPLAGLHGPDDFLVLCAKDEVIGCAAIERYGRVGLLRSVAVTATERNRGLGRFLIEELLTRARQEQLAELVLLTTTAEKFFFRIGFRTIQRGQVPLAAQSSVEFQSACPASATIMLLKL